MLITVCQTEEQFQEFNEITRQITLAKNMEEVSKLTGCYTNCHYVRYNSKFESENKVNHQYSNVRKTHYTIAAYVIFNDSIWYSLNEALLN